MSKRKKILLLSDDIRMNSGVARMGREFVEGTCEKYDWVQIAGAVKHPEAGKRIDIQSDPKFPLPKSACHIGGFAFPFDLLYQEEGISGKRRKKR